MPDPRIIGGYRAGLHSGGRPRGCLVFVERDNLMITTTEAELSRRRFDLVKIAFKKALANQAQKERDIPAVPLTKAVVEYADAVLAEMEKKPDANDSPPLCEQDMSEMCHRCVADEIVEPDTNERTENDD